MRDHRRRDAVNTPASARKDAPISKICAAILLTLGAANAHCGMGRQTLEQDAAAGHAGADASMDSSSGATVDAPEVRDSGDASVSPVDAAPSSPTYYCGPEPIDGGCGLCNYDGIQPYWCSFSCMIFAVDRLDTGMACPVNNLSCTANNQTCTCSAGSWSCSVPP